MQHALRVGTIVRGEVEPASRGARITVRALDAVSGTEFGRKSFDVDTTKALAAQDQVAEQVAEFLRSDRRLRGPAQGITRGDDELTGVDAGAASREAPEGRGLAHRRRADRARRARCSVLPTRSWCRRSRRIPDGRSLCSRARRSRTSGRASSASSRSRARATVDSGLAYANRALALEARSADALELRGELRLPPRGFPPRARRTAMAGGARQRRSRPSSRGRPESRPGWRVGDVEPAVVQEAGRGIRLHAAQQAYKADAYLTNARDILQRLFWTSHDNGDEPGSDQVVRRRTSAIPARMDSSWNAGMWMMTTKAVRPDPDEAWRTRGFAARHHAGGAVALRKPDGADARSPECSPRRSCRTARGHVLERAHASRSSVDPDGELFGIADRDATVHARLRSRDRRCSASTSPIIPDHRKGLATNTSPWWKDPQVQNDPRFKQLIAGAR